MGGRFLKWGGRWEYRKAFGFELRSRMIRNKFFAQSDLREREEAPSEFFLVDPC